MCQKSDKITSYCRFVKSLNSCFVMSVCQTTSKQLLKCLFPEYSRIDKSYMLCSPAYFPKYTVYSELILPGCLSFSLTSLDAAPYMSCVGTSRCFTYTSGCLQTATISDSYPILQCYCCSMTGNHQRESRQLVLGACVLSLTLSYLLGLNTALMCHACDIVSQYTRLHPDGWSNNTNELQSIIKCPCSIIVLVLFLPHLKD